MTKVRTEDGRRRRCGQLSGLELAVAAIALVVLGAPRATWAQVPATLTGAPIQVTPYVSEPGVPEMTIPTGTATAPSTGTDTGTGTTGDSTTGTDSDALATLLAQSWGATAVSEAEALGLNPSAVAATCEIESGCQNVDGASGAQGAFQMYSAAYQEGLQTALAADPSLASEIVQGSAGMNDPATEAVAASGYLLQANQALENAGISQPTVLDVRGYYNFGPAAGTQIAQASDGDLMSDYVSSSALTTNNIPFTETVGQWKAAVTATIGTAANQPVLS